jgi:hypothetical protein
VLLPQHEWQELGSRRRRQVAGLARRGRTHPDAYVAAVALAWARQTAPPPATARHRLARAAVVTGWFGLLALVAPLLGPFADLLVPDLGPRRDRRLARRILAAHPG